MACSRVWPVMMGLIMTLNGCTDVRQKLGLDPDAPDEFTVYDRPPLSVPPHYALRPPRPGASRPQEIAVSTLAEKILAKGDVAAPRVVADSPGKAALLHEAGIAESEKEIRRQVDEDLSLSQEPTDKQILKDVLFWQKKSPEGAVLDAQKEKRRLEEQKAKTLQGA